MFRIADIVVIILFFIGMAGIAWYFARRNNSTEEYFLGNRSFPGWAIGISMLGTSISSVTFLALPAAAFILDYRQMVNNLAMPVAGILAVCIFIPFFRRGSATSAFEYLEARYGVAVRTYAALSFIILQLIRIATILYLVSIPVSAMLNMNIVWVMIIGGVFIGLYTVFGGIEAVIWTDVIQTIILLLGGLVCLGIILHALPGGIGEVFEIGSQFDKFSLGPVKWGFSERTFTVMLLLGLTGFTTEYSSNQNVIQRYIAAKSTREARKATLICVCSALPTWILFFFLGTCLFVFYNVFPSEAVKGLSADEVLPHFILTETFPGLGGLIIAACMAAAMSSLDSSINAIATIGTVDFVKRFGKPKSDRQNLFIAKIIAVIAGCIMILGGIVIIYIPKESVNDFNIIVASLFGGGMLSIYMLGFFNRRVSYRSIVIGVILAILANLYLMLNSFGWLPACLSISGIHVYWTSIIVNLVLAFSAYMLSFLFPNRKKLDGLTVWTLKKS